MEAAGATQLPLSPALEHTPASEQRSAKKVTFSASSEAPQHEASPTREAGKAGTTAAATSPALFSNQLFSPERSVLRQGSWTIEAQRSDRGMQTPASAGGSTLTAGAYSPASSSWLESARKVEDLRGRLESLEQALKDMESRAVEQLDRSLQDKVLATAAKIVQKRFMADKELDQKLQKQILQTAIKVVKRQGVAHAAAAAQDAAAPAGGAEGKPAQAPRRLEFEQGEGSDATAAGVVEQVVAHIEQGLGEVLRRLERKVEGVASLVDQNVLELLEARLAGGLLQLEARLKAVEEAEACQQEAAGTAPAAGASAHLLERVSAVEAAMAEQTRAVKDLLAALGAQQGAAQQVGAAVAAVAATMARQPAAVQQGATAPRPAAARPADEQPAAAQRDAQPTAASAATAEAGPASGSAAQPPAVLQQRQSEPARAAPASQLHQRRGAVARRSSLGDPSRAAAASPRHSLPRLKTHHPAGTAQQIAIATARQQLALKAQREREEAEVESPVWLTMLYVFGWGALAVLGLAAVATGMVAMLVRSGRLQESDLEFLWN